MVELVNAVLSLHPSSHMLLSIDLFLLFLFSHGSFSFSSSSFFLLFHLPPPPSVFLHPLSSSSSIPFSIFHSSLTTVHFLFLFPSSSSSSFPFSIFFSSLSTTQFSLPFSFLLSSSSSFTFPFYSSSNSSFSSSLLLKFIMHSFLYLLLILPSWLLPIFSSWFYSKYNFNITQDTEK